MSLEDTFYPLLKLYESAPRPVKSLAGRAFRALPAAVRHGGSYARFQQELREVTSWDEETIRSYQIQAVRDSLLVAAQAPFYARTFAEHGVAPAKFDSLEQLADFPLLTKEEVAVHGAQMVNPAIPAGSRLQLTTGGSTGVPLRFYLQKGVSRAKEQAYLESMWARVGYEPGARVAVIRGHDVKPGKPWYFDASRNWMIFSSAMLSEATAPEYMSAINRFRPQFIHAYPSSAMLLGELMNAASLKLEHPIKALLCGSEHLSDEDNAWLAGTFSTKVFRWYGHSERVVLAGENIGAAGFHFWPAYGFVEFGPQDESGWREVIGTSFHNHVMPFIRYRTGDYVRVAADPPPFGSALRCVTEIAGRESEFVLASDGRRVPLTVVNMHDDCYDGWSALQFYQSTPGSLEVRYQPSAHFQHSMIPRIESRILQRLGPGFGLTFREVRDVERASSGKHRWLAKSMIKGGEA